LDAIDDACAVLFRRRQFPVELPAVFLRRGAVCFLSGAGLTACKDVGLFETLSCPWPLSPTFYKLLEIER